MMTCPTMSWRVAIEDVLDGAKGWQWMDFLLLQVLTYGMCSARDTPIIERLQCSGVTGLREYRTSLLPQPDHHGSEYVTQIAKPSQYSMGTLTPLRHGLLPAENRPRRH